METEKPRFGPEQYEGGDIIISQGDLPEKFYIITHGYVDVEHSSPSGVHIIDRLGPGDFFGEIGLMKHKRRNATVRARGNVAVMSMDQRTFANWLSTSGLVKEELTELVDIREKRAGQWGGANDEHVEANFPPRPQIAEEQQTAVPPAPSPTTSQGPLQFSPGEIIVHQGAPANRFYIIIEGEVEVVQIYDMGEEVSIGRMNDGQYFGEIGLLEEGSIRTATIRAVTAVKLLPFTRDQFRSWMAKSPDSKSEIVQTAHQRRSRDTGPLQLPD